MGMRTYVGLSLTYLKKLLASIKATRAALKHADEVIQRASPNNRPALVAERAKWQRYLNYIIADGRRFINTSVRGPAFQKSNEMYKKRQRVLREAVSVQKQRQRLANLIKKRLVSKGVTSVNIPRAFTGLMKRSQIEAMRPRHQSPGRYSENMGSTAHAWVPVRYNWVPVSSTKRVRRNN